MYSHRLESKGPAMYEETTHIPLIMRWRGKIPENVITPHPVTHVDITPTILEAAGIEVPRFLEGKSLMPTMKDPAKQINDVVFMEFNRFELNNEAGSAQAMVNIEVRESLHKRILEWMDKSRDPIRGYIWTHREWSMERQRWRGSGMTRPRPDDGYEPRVNLYETGLPVGKWEYEKKE